MFKTRDGFRRSKTKPGNVHLRDSTSEQRKREVSADRGEPCARDSTVKAAEVQVRSAPFE
jgi:hypothetical protein